MEQFPLKRIVIPLIIVVLIFAFSVINTMAAEKIKVGDTRYWFGTKMEVIKVGDTEGHVIQVTESKGIDMRSKNFAVASNTWDLVKGTGTMYGYTTMMETDGKPTRFLKQEGKAIGFLSPEGKHMISGEGTWTMVKGVGEWQGATGGGTWKMKTVSPGIFVMDWEGELVKP